MHRHDLLSATCQDDHRFGGSLKDPAFSPILQHWGRRKRYTKWNLTWPSTCSPIACSMFFVTFATSLSTTRNAARGINSPFLAGFAHHDWLLRFKLYKCKVTAISILTYLVNNCYFIQSNDSFSLTPAHSPACFFMNGNIIGGIGFFYFMSSWCYPNHSLRSYNIVHTRLTLFKKLFELKVGLFNLEVDGELRGVLIHPREGLVLNF